MAFETTYKPYIPVSAQKDFEELLTKWNNAEKAQAIAVLKKSMSEQAETKKVETTVVQSYIEHTIKAGMNSSSLPNYPADFTQAAKSTYYKQAIQEVVKELGEEFKVNETNNAFAKAAWAEVQKAKTIVDFRKQFKLYLVAIQSEMYTKEDLQCYTEEIEALTKQVQELQYYKQAYQQIFDVVLEDKNDPANKQAAKTSEEQQEKRTVLEAQKLKELGFKDHEVLKALNIDGRKLRHIKKKVGVVDEHTTKAYEEGVKRENKIKEQQISNETAKVKAKKTKQSSQFKTEEDYFASCGIDTTLEGI